MIKNPGIDAPEEPSTFLESRIVAFQTASVHNPHHVDVKRLALTLFIGTYGRVLEFNNKSSVSFYVRDVFIT